jgi:hypothetical protein
MTDDTMMDEITVTDETMPKKRGRKPKAQEESALPIEETPVAPEPEAVPAPPLTPESVLKPILDRYRYTETAPTLVRYSCSSPPKGQWMLMPVDCDTLEAAWRAYRAHFGTMDQDRFIRVVHSILGMAMDSTIRSVNLLRLE